MAKTIIRVPNTYDSDLVSSANAFECVGESMTRQEFLEESDINTIIAMFGIGENPVQPQNWVKNVDIVDATSDFQSAMNQLVAAANQFNSLPADLRGRFQNDPAKFVDFVSNPDNMEEMVRLGLAEQRAVPAPSDTDRIVAALAEIKAGSGTVSP